MFAPPTISWELMSATGKFVGTVDGEHFATLSPIGNRATRVTGWNVTVETPDGARTYVSRSRNEAMQCAENVRAQIAGPMEGWS